MECKHFKRGKLFEDNTCSQICKDEIVLVDELGETHGSMFSGEKEHFHGNVYRR